MKRHTGGTSQLGWYRRLRNKTVCCTLLALGAWGAARGAQPPTAQPSSVQFDPSRFLPTTPNWKGAEKDQPENPKEQTKSKDEEAKEEARPNRFSAQGGQKQASPSKDEAKGHFRSTPKPAPPDDDEAKTSKPAKQLPDLGGGEGKRLLIIPVGGTIDLGLAPFMERLIKEAGESKDTAALILDINTFGGRVDAAVRIKDALLGSKLPTICFINRRAISAGALISFACDIIAAPPGATMGAATPVQMGGGGQAQPVAEKVVSYMRKEMRSTAEAKGRDGDLAEAMVDADEEIHGISAKGKLLTVTTEEGMKLGLFDLRCETLEELYVKLNAAKATPHRAVTNWGEDLARMLTDPTVSGILMSLGFLGLLMELYTAGFSGAGAVGLLCLMLFFLGHVAANLAGWEEILLLMAGIALLGVEAFVFGGSAGIVGAAGLLMMIIAMVMTLMEAPVDLSWSTGALTNALSRVALSMVATLAAAAVLTRFVPKTRVFRRLVLESGLGASVAPAPDVAVSEGSAQDLVGEEGVTLTPLRPFGKARIAGRKREVASEGPFVESGETVRVIRVDGRDLFVRKMDPTESQAEEA